MTTQTNQPLSAFPELDAVIRRQRTLKQAGRFVTFALMLGAAGVISSVAACSSDDEAAQAGTPLPAADEGVQAFRRDALTAMPDASFDMVAIEPIDAETTRTTVDVVGTLRAPFMGEDELGSTVYLRVVLTTRRDGSGHARILRDRIEE